MNTRTLRPMRALITLCLLLLLPAAVQAAVQMVTNTNDSGAGSLRQAMLSATHGDEIRFNIPGTGVKTISPLSPLPTVTTSTLTIDGRTQPGFTGTPLIEINGTSAGAGTPGLRVENGSTVELHSVIINRFASDGIRVGSATSWGRLHLFGCWIGVNRFGNVPAPNRGHGINIIYNGIDGSVIGASDSPRNVISGNAGDGIRVDPSVTYYVAIFNNLIGLGANGTADCGNGGNGITAAPYFEITNYYYGMFIGRPFEETGLPMPNTGNFISCNGGDGIHIPGTVPQLPTLSPQAFPIYRNFIGTDVSGTLARGNDGNGIYIGPNNRCDIGNLTGAGNLITSNGLSGILLDGVIDTNIAGNFIGTTNTAASLGNGQSGIRLLNFGIAPGFSAISSLTVSGCTIGANGSHGISLEGTGPGDCDMNGNYIGTTAAGADAGNGGDGIHAGGAGSYYAGPGFFPARPTNRIAYNNGAGIRVLPTANCRYYRNEIWENGGLGIDLGPAGVSPNDPGDGDSGANGMQNFPVLLNASPVRVGGTLNSAPLVTYEIDLYAAVQDPTGYGEGRSFIASTSVTTGADGNASFVFTGLSLTPGTYLTATADPSSGPGYTSEFSRVITVAGQDTGDFRMSGTALSVAENAGSATLTVYRTGTSGEVSVQYTTAPGTASAGQDFSAQSGVLQFASGQVFRTITFPVINDSADESDETFTVTLSNPLGGPLLGSPAATTVTILDNDNPPAVSVNSAAVKEGNVGNTPLNFTVTLSAPSGLPVSVSWVTSDHTATHTIDYSGGGSGIITFNPGETSKVLIMQAIGDTTQETNETFQVVLSSPVNAVAGTMTGTGAVLDDDSPGAIQFTTAAYSITESSETGLSLFVIRNGGGPAVTVNYAFSGGTATPFVDYDTSGMSGTLSFASGETVKLLTLSPVDDGAVEGPETVLLTLSNPIGGATLGGVSTATITITDDDFAASLHGRVILASGTGLPGVTVTLSGSQSATFTTDVSGFYQFSGLPLGGNYTVTAAKAGYTFAPASLSFPALNTSLLDQNITASNTEAPDLQMAFGAGNTVTLSWPLETSFGWVLQQSATLQPDDWQDVPLSSESGESLWNTVTLSSTARKFFRLVLR